MVRAPDPGDLVFVEQLLDEPLGLRVDLHEGNVGYVDEEEEGGLEPLDAFIAEEDDERDEGERVEGAVAEQRPPGEVQHSLGEERAHACEEETWEV